MNFINGKPIYAQIASRLADEILLRVYSEGGRIPSVRDYAAQMQVNANTAVRSYARLEQLGVIETRRGLGYFVALGAREAIRVARRKEFFEGEVPEFFRQIDVLGIGIGEIDKLYHEHLQNAAKRDAGDSISTAEAI